MSNLSHFHDKLEEIIEDHKLDDFVRMEASTLAEFIIDSLYVLKKAADNERITKSHET